MSAIQLSHPLVFWTDLLSSPGKKAKGQKTTGRPDPRLVDRAELLIEGPTASGKTVMHYAQVHSGQLYAARLHPDWAAAWKKLASGTGDHPDRADYVKHLGDALEVVERRYTSGKRPLTGPFISGRPYRIWVDYWLADWDASLDPLWDGRRAAAVSHTRGDDGWQAPVPALKGWEEVTIKRGAQNHLLLTCRRFAFFPRLYRLTTELERWTARYATRVGELGAARAHFDALRVTMACLQKENASTLMVTGKRGVAADYARLGKACGDALAVSQAFLLEDEKARSYARNAAYIARRLYGALAKPESPFVADLNAREEAGGVSDQMRALVARAALALFKAPGVTDARDLKSGEDFELSADGTRIAAVTCTPKPLVTLAAQGSSPVQARGYFATRSWAERYYTNVYKRDVEAAAKSDSWVDKASPLFALREQLTLVATGLMNTALQDVKPEAYTKALFKLLNRKELLSLPEGYGWDASLEKNYRAFAAATGQWEEPTKVSKLKGVSGFALGNGLTAFIKLATWHDKAQKAGASTSPTDELAALHAGVDAVSNTLALGDDLAHVLTTYQKGAAIIKGASTAAQYGAVLGVVADTMETGLFVYAEFNADQREQNAAVYTSDFNDRLAVYNGLIAAGKSVNTVGSGFLCSAVGAPVGIVLKASGQGVANLAELAREIDRIGEAEEATVRRIWKQLDGGSPAVKAFYQKLEKELALPTKWSDFPTLIDAIGDWRAIKEKEHLDLIKKLCGVRTVAAAPK